MPRSNQYQYRQLDVPEVTPQAVLVTAILGFTLIYSLLHSITGLPSIFELIFVCIPGWIFGRAARERLQMMFGYATVGLGTSQGIVERVRMRAGSILGVPGNQKGLGYVGGLWNMGNTCYQNSVLQAMASLDHLQPLLNALADDDRTDEGPFHSYALGDLIHSLNTITTSSRTFNAPSFVASTGANTWRYNEQQDAQEFFQRLTGALEKEVSQYWADMQDKPGLEAVKAGENGIEFKQDEVSKRILPIYLRSPFEGLLAQRVGCVSCHYVEAIRLQTFTTLSLPLPSNDENTLEECLAEFTSMEYLDQVDCDRCSLLKRADKLRSMLHPPPDGKPLSAQLVDTVKSRLEEVETALENDDYRDSTIKALKISPKVSSTKTKHIMIARPPPVFVLHINRSRFNPITGMSSKNFAPVRVPKVLDMSEFMTRHDALDLNPGKPISATIPKNSKKESVPGSIYELKSVISHYGGHHNGHYISYRKSKGLWYRISDDEVYASNEQEVTSIQNAFMLFYEQNDTVIYESEELPTEKVELVEQEAPATPTDYDTDASSASDPGITPTISPSSTDLSPSTAAPSFSSTNFTPETPPSTPPSSAVFFESGGETPPLTERRTKDGSSTPEISHLPSPPATEFDGSEAAMSRLPSESPAEPNERMKELA